MASQAGGGGPAAGEVETSVNSAEARRIVVAMNDVDAEWKLDGIPAPDLQSAQAAVVGRPTASTAPDDGAVAGTTEPASAHTSGSAPVPEVLRLATMDVTPAKLQEAADRRMKAAIEADTEAALSHSLLVEAASATPTRVAQPPNGGTGVPDDADRSNDNGLRLSEGTGVAFLASDCVHDTDLAPYIAALDGPDRELSSAALGTPAPDDLAPVATTATSHGGIAQDAGLQDVRGLSTAMKDAARTLRCELEAGLSECHAPVLGKLSDLSAAFLVEAAFGGQGGHRKRGNGAKRATPQGDDDGAAELRTQFRVHSDLASRIVFDEFKSKAKWVLSAVDAFTHSLLQTHDRTQAAHVAARRKVVDSLRARHQQRCRRIREACRVHIAARMRLHTAHLNAERKAMHEEAAARVLQARLRARELVQQARTEKVVAERRHANATVEIKRLKDALRRLTSAMGSTGADPLALVQQYTARIDALEAEVEAGQGTQEELDKVTAAHRAAAKEVESLRESDARHRTIIRGLETRLEEAQKECTGLRGEVAELKSAAASHAAKADSHDAQATEWKTRAQGAELKVNELEGHMKLAKERIADLEGEVQVLTRDKEAANGVAGKDAARVRRLSVELGKQQALLNDHNARLGNMQRAVRRASLSGDVIPLQRDLAAAVADVTRLRSEKLALESKVRFESLRVSLVRVHTAYSSCRAGCAGICLNGCSRCSWWWCNRWMGRPKLVARLAQAQPPLPAVLKDPPMHPWRWC